MQELTAGLAAADEPEEIRIANVAGAEMRAALQPLLADRFHAPQQWARSPRAAGLLRNGYHDPSQLGVDRWLGLCAAWQPGRGLCLAASGTALTVDLVRADGQHQGGVILPGLLAMRSAVLAAAPDLSRVAERFPAPRRGGDDLGRDTHSAIVLGAVRAATALIDSCRSRLAALGPVDLVLTGGDAGELAAAIPAGTAATLRPQLVLEGLARTPACFDVES